MLGAEHSMGDNFSALIQYSAGTPVLRGFRNREVDQAAANLVFGLAGRVGSVSSWEASFQEDVPADTLAIDCTLGARLSLAW